MANNVAVGILRPPNIFFYEVDCKRGYFRQTKYWLIQDCKYNLKQFSLYRTKHGYHIIGYPYSKALWEFFSWCYPSDYTKKLKPRFGKRNPQILRISEKFNLKTGKIVSAKPKLVYGNFILTGIQNYKVIYYAK